jgi:hypothetical protein
MGKQEGGRHVAFLLLSIAHFLAAVELCFASWNRYDMTALSRTISFRILIRPRC